MSDFFSLTLVDEERLRELLQKEQQLERAMKIVEAAREQIRVLKDSDGDSFVLRELVDALTALEAE